MPLVTPPRKIFLTNLGFRAEASAADNSWQGIAWSPQLSLFVAVGDGATPVMTSPDGRVWTARAASNQLWMDVAWSPALGLFVAVAQTGAQRVMTSPDGINWTLRNASNNALLWKSVAWSPEKSIFVATHLTNSADVMTSVSGIAWATRAIDPLVTNGLNKVVWSRVHKLFFAVNSSVPPGRGASSPDGIVWTSVTLPDGGTRVWGSIAVSPTLKRIVILSETPAGTSAAAFSDDGITFTHSVTLVPSLLWRSAVWSETFNAYIAVAQNGVGVANQVIFSRDGTTWIAGESANLLEWRAMAQSKEVGAVVGVAQTGVGNRVQRSCAGFRIVPRF
jgi:hypothetical protein